MYTIRKGSRYKGDRMIIRGFKTSDAMHTFLNKQLYHEWTINSDPETATLKPGTYAYAGGCWHNIKSLDASVLAHI